MPIKIRYSATGWGKSKTCKIPLSKSLWWCGGNKIKLFYKYLQQCSDDMRWWVEEGNGLQTCFGYRIHRPWCVVFAIKNRFPAWASDHLHNWAAWLFTDGANPGEEQAGKGIGRPGLEMLGMTCCESAKMKRWGDRSDKKICVQNRNQWIVNIELIFKTMGMNKIG